MFEINNIKVDQDPNDICHVAFDAVDHEAALKLVNGIFKYARGAILENEESALANGEFIRLGIFDLVFAVDNANIQVRETSSKNSSGNPSIALMSVSSFMKYNNLVSPSIADKVKEKITELYREKQRY